MDLILRQMRRTSQGQTIAPRRTLYLDQGLIERVERLAMEEHPSTVLGQQGTEPWLRVCVVFRNVVAVWETATTFR
jgi:hypothetical protein